MFQQRSDTFSERYNPNDFVIDDGETSYFKNSWEQAKILENSRAEEKGMLKLASEARESIIKDNPTQEANIRRWLVYEDSNEHQPFIPKKGVHYKQNLQLGKLQRKRYARLFDNGRIYMDEAGQMVGNTEDAQSIVDEEQEDIQGYWNYRQLTDGTEFDMVAMEKKLIASQQDELIRLRQQARGSDSIWDTMGTFAGSMAFVATEPESILAIVGGTGNVGKGIIKNSLTAVAKEAGLSVMVDAMLQPKILEWRRKLYDPARGIEAYSTLDAVKSTIMNATFSGLMQGTGSLVVDGVTKLKYRGVTKAGTSKFDIIDANRASQFSFGSLEWRTQRRKQLAKETGAPINSQVIDDAVDIATSSPQANMDIHAENINRSIENTENDIGFSENDLHKTADVAQTNDFVAIKDGDGEAMLARVTDADDDYLIIDTGDGKSVLIDRASKVSGDDRWTVSDTIESKQYIDNKIDVNQPDIEFQLSKRESAEAELVAVHSEDIEIKHYNTSMDEIVQRGIDSGCFTMNQINGGQ